MTSDKSPADYVRGWRERQGLSAVELAELLGAGISTIHTWESARVQPRPGKLDRMRAFDRGELCLVRGPGGWQWAPAADATRWREAGWDVREVATPDVTAMVSALSRLPHKRLQGVIEALQSSLAARVHGVRVHEQLRTEGVSGTVAPVVCLRFQRFGHSTRRIDEPREGMHTTVPRSTADTFRAARQRAGVTSAELLRAIARAIDDGEIVVPAYAEAED